MKVLARFRRARRGNVALLAAVFLPALIAGTGYALDYMNMSRYHVLLQEAADAAAVASARQLNFMEGLNPGQRKKALRDFAQQMVDIQLLPTQRPAKAKLQLLEEDRVEVVATHIMKPIFHGLPGFDMFPVSARAVAQALQGQNVCVIATEPKSDDAIRLDGAARIAAPTCAVYSNSAGANGVHAHGGSKIEAALICSVGGAKHPENYIPDATTDCPTLEDPLATRAAPDLSGWPCLVTSSVTIDGSSTLPFLPGRYCADVVIKDATVYLTPGVYWFENAKLSVEGAAKLIGSNVGFYFHDDASTFDFKDSATVDLSGRTSGSMAGMVVYANPTAAKREFKITTPNVTSLVGTVYMPADLLTIDTTSDVADSSAFTVMIVRELKMMGSPSLVLNSNYDLTTVPVPEGVQNVGARSRLVQ